jgi:hypothetical protein
MSKIELEINELEEEFKVHKMGGGESEVTALNAAKCGVRFTRTMSVQLNAKLQGDMTMLTEKAMTKRLTLKAESGCRGLVEKWWNSMGSESLVGGAMEKKGYITMSIALHQLLSPQVTEFEARRVAQQDWESDCKVGSFAMDFDTFYDS